MGNHWLKAGQELKKRPYIKLDDAKFTKQVEDDIASDKQATDIYRRNREYWNQLAQNEPVNINADTDTSDTREEFNVSMPLIPTAIDQHHARFNTHYLQTKPPIRIAPTDKHDVDKVRLNQDFDNWALMNNTPNFQRTFDENGLITLTEGQSFVYSTWVREERKVCHEHAFQATYLTFDPYGNAYPQQITIEEIIRSLFDVENEKRVMDFEDQGNDRYKVSYQIKRNPTNSEPWTDHTAVIDFFMDGDDPETATIIAKVISNEIVFEGVKILNLNLDYLYFPKDIDSLQPPDCPHLIIMSEETLSEVRSKQKDGTYDLLNDEKMKKIARHVLDEKGLQPDGSTSEGKSAIEDIEGTCSQLYPAEIVKVYKCFYSKDIDDDGIDEEILVTVFPDVQVVGRARFLEEEFRHARRPVRHIVYDIRPYTILGKGIPEKLKSIQELYDDIWNQILNYGAVITLPFFFYLAGGNMDAQVYKLRPGEGYPLGSLDDIRWPQFANNLPIDFAMLQQVRSDYERYGKINDPMMGRPGAARQTATATLKLLGEGMEGQSINFQRFRRGWGQVFEDFHQLYRAYMPDYMKFRVWDQMADAGQGDWDFRNISRRDMIEHPDIDFDISIESTSTLFQREMWMQLFQFTVNPVTIQAGICTPVEIGNLLDRVYDSYGIKDKANFIARPQAMAPPMDPMDENRMMASGQYVDPNPQENFQMHMASHMQFEINGQVAPEYKPIFMKHKMVTMQMAQQQESMLKMAQAASQLPPEMMLGNGGNRGGEFMARPDVGRSPMQALGNAQAAGRQNQPMNLTNTAAPIQG